MDAYYQIHVRVSIHTCAKQYHPQQPASFTANRSRQATTEARLRELFPLNLPRRHNSCQHRPTTCKPHNTNHKQYFKAIPGNQVVVGIK